MRTLPILALLLAATALAAEDQPQPRQLDPSKPADAVVIIDALTQDLQLPRRQADAFRAALETLARHVAESPKPATPPPAESASAKKD